MINISDIFLPSCKVKAYTPEGSRIIKDYLETNYDIEVTGCCKINYKSFTGKDRIVYLCNSCAAHTEESTPSNMISLWELIDQDDNFDFPDYSGRKMAIQDCWRSYDRKSQQVAIRSLLEKMNIEVEEMDENFEKTRFCGISTLKDLPIISGKLAPRRFTEDAEGLFLPHSEEDKQRLMEKHCQEIHSDEVICYCTACIEGISLGEKKGYHLLDVLLGLVKLY
ncbi:MAG: hypothetical protein WC996_03735 [Peptostreptococcales bacterium]